MFDNPGVVVSKPQVDLSNYQRSRLGRWEVAKEVKSDDPVFGILLKTPAGPIRIRFETTVNGKAFREAREKTIDELLAIAKGEVKRVAKPADKEVAIKEPAVKDIGDEEKKVEEKAIEEPPVTEDAADPEIEFEAPEAYVAQSAKDRMVAYVQSRGDRLTRYELRRRVADIAGGPSLLRTTNDFGSQRHQTMTLFAFLDTNEDGVISPQEKNVAVQALNDCDANADGRTSWNEIKLGLKSRTFKRKTNTALIDWQPWEVSQSDAVGELRVAVSFNDTEDKSGLTISECKLDEQWGVVTAKVRRSNAESNHGSILLASHPKVSMALSAAQSPDETNNSTEQISIGVALGANALFQRIDQDGDWSLNTDELNSFSEVIKSLDTNADGTLAASELPILLRVCVCRGAKAHEALSHNVSIVLEPDEQGKSFQAAPEWFTSMDQDGSRTLTRTEFLGERKSFDKIDTDQNDLLSVTEALAA